MVCFDLPSNGNLDQLKHYALALSPDGQALYAANGALGSITKIDLSNLQVVQPVEFTPLRSGPNATGGYQTDGHGIVSSDGQTLYFADGDEVWSYDPWADKVAGPYFIGNSILGLGLNDSDKRLYVATPANGPAVMFDIQKNGLLVRVN